MNESIVFMGVKVSRVPFKDAHMLLTEVEKLTDFSHEEKCNWLSRMCISLMTDAMKETKEWQGLGWYMYNLLGHISHSKYKLKMDFGQLHYPTDEEWDEHMELETFKEEMYAEGIMDDEEIARLLDLATLKRRMYK